MNTIIHESRTHRRKSEEIPIPSRQLCLYHPATHPPLLILCVVVLFFSAFFSVSQLHNTSILYHLTPEPDTRIPLPNISTLPYPPLPYPTGSRRRWQSQPLHVSPLSLVAVTPRGSPPPRHSLTHSLTSSFGRCVGEREDRQRQSNGMAGGLKRRQPHPNPLNGQSRGVGSFQGSGFRAR